MNPDPNAVDAARKNLWSSGALPAPESYALHVALLEDLIRAIVAEEFAAKLAVVAALDATWLNRFAQDRNEGHLTHEELLRGEGEDSALLECVRELGAALKGETHA
jgi:hypothetical protein